MYRFWFGLTVLSVACSSGARYQPDEFVPPISSETFYQPERVTAGSEANYSPDLSRSGVWLSYTSDRGDNKDIWRKSINGGFAKQLTSHIADDFAPAISPNEEMIAFVSRRNDAGGDIHIMNVGGFSLFGGSEQEEPGIRSISLPSTEDTNPAWFPDSKKIVFAARLPGEAIPQLMIASLGTGQASAILDAKGDQPAVSPDGTKIVFVRNGAIFIWHSDDNRIQQITEGGIVQDGQPNFTPDGQSLVFVRYLDDTNDDKKLNGDDHGTVWQIDLQRQGHEKNLENYNIIPLTSAAHSAYSPQVRGDHLFLGLQTDDSLDVFRLPKNGQVQAANDLADLLNILDQQTDSLRKSLILRFTTTSWFRQGKLDEASAAALLEIEMLAESGKDIEAKWAYFKFKKSFEHLSSKIALADLAIIELELSPLRYPDYSKNLSADDLRFLQVLEQRVLKILSDADSGTQFDRSLLRASARIVQAKILAAKRQFFPAIEIFTDIVENNGSHRGVQGRASLWRAIVTRATADLDTSVSSLRQVVKDYQDDRVVVRNASNYAVSLIVNQSDDVVEGLVRLRNDAAKLPIMPALAHLHIADYYRDQGKPAVEANELRQIVELYPESPEITVNAAARLIALEERQGRYDAAEKTLVKLNHQFGLAKNRYQSKARELLVQFLIRRGEGHLQQKKLKEAEIEYNKVLAIEPDNINAHRGLIDAAYFGRKWQDLLKFYAEKANKFEDRASWRYVYAYALTYKIDECKTIPCRISAINIAIDEVLAARELNSQILQIHQTLGWLDLQLDYWKKRHRDSRSLIAWLNHRWSITRSTFGSGEPNLLMAAIDAFQTAYFLSERETIEEASLAQNLGQAYFELGNFQKSLTYFARRIRMLPFIPMRDARAEGVLLRRAGRAAFQTDNLELAEVLQKRALALWESLSEDEQIASALDSLALTIRERGRYVDALPYYERLLAYSKKRADIRSQILNQQAIGYCYFFSEEYEKSLISFVQSEALILEARSLIARGELVEDDFSTDAIRVPMPGASTAPDGLSINRMAVVAYSFKAMIFEKMARVDLQINELLNKIAMLKKERQRMVSVDGYGKTILHEEISLAYNELGNLYFSHGQHALAKSAFDDARLIASETRPENQKYMTAAEQINFVNTNRIQLRLAQLGLLSTTEIIRTVRDLDAEAAELKPAITEGAIIEARPMSQMLTISALIQSTLDDVDAMKESKPRDRLHAALLAQESANLRPRDRRATLFASVTIPELANGAVYESVSAEVARFVDGPAKSDAIKWKISASKQDWNRAFEEVAWLIESGKILKSPSDRQSFRNIFDHLVIDDKLTGSSRMLLLRRYLRLRFLDLARRSFLDKTDLSHDDKEKKRDLPAGLREILDLKDEKSIVEKLSDHDAIFLVHRTLSGKVFGFAIGPEKIGSAVIDASGRDFDDPVAYNRLLDQAELKNVFPREGGRLYICPSAELYDVDWDNIRVFGERMVKRFQLVYLPSPDHLPSVFAKRNLPKHTIGYVRQISASQDAPASSASADSVEHVFEKISKANSGRFYQEIVADGQVSIAKRFALFDLVHVDAPFYLNDSKPINSVIKISLSPIQSLNATDATIRQISQLELPSTNALILSHVNRFNTELALSGEGSDGWVTATMAAAEAGISTLVMSSGKEWGYAAQVIDEKSMSGSFSQMSQNPEHNGDTWTRFYQLLNSQSVAEAVRQSGLRARVHGYGGIPSHEEDDYAREHYESVVEEAEDFWAQKNYMAAAGAYKKALYFAKRLGHGGIANSYLDRIVKAYFQKREFDQALVFQKKLIENLRSDQNNIDNDPVDYARALLEAAVVAVKAEAYDFAFGLLDEAKAIAEKEEDASLLGQVWRYRAIGYEAQNKYQETISAYEKSIEFYREESPRQASLLLLAIGNIYASRLSEFTKAINYFDLAAEDLKSRSEHGDYLQVLTDKSAALMQIGELQEAISILETSVLPNLDRQKNLVQWIRAYQRLANCYYRSGLYQDASEKNASVLEALDDIDQDGLRVSLSLDAVSLQGMILARTGKLNEAFDQFNNGIKEAQTYKLDGQLAMLYNNYGFWAREAGQVDKSLDLFNLALKIDEKAKSQRDIAYDQRNLGFSVILKGDFNRAQGLLQAALETSKALNISHNIAYCYFGLGDLYLRQKKWQSAAQAFADALKIAKKGYLWDFVWRAHAGIAASYSGMNQYLEVETNLAEAVSVIERLRAGLRADGSRNQFYSEIGVQDVFEKYAVVLMRQGKIEESWRVAERSRARAFLDAIGSQKFHFSDERNNNLLEIEKTLRSEVELFERKISTQSNRDVEDGLSQSLARARAAYTKHIDEMLRPHPHLAQFVASDAIEKKELLDLLGNGTALIQYLVSESDLLIWVFRDGVMSGRLVEIGAKDIELRVRDFRTLMENFSSPEYLGSELADILIKPIRDLLTNARRIAIVPHRNLHFLSFAALPDSDRYLIDLAPIFYLDSATMLRFSTLKDIVTDGTKARVLALANPYNSDQRHMPFTEREVKAISRYYSDALIYSDSNAQESLLSRSHQKFGILHIASHGEFNPDDPAKSSLLLANGGGEDGILTVSEAFELPIQADLVTLSACESGMGALSRGEEVVGMNRAFLFRGARTVVSALWRISDVTSAVTMKRFYRYLAAGDDRAEAMRKAQSVVRKYFKHPAYWAGFRVFGSYL